MMGDLQSPTPARARAALTAPAARRIVVAGDWHGNTAWAMHVVEQTAAIDIDTIRRRQQRSCKPANPVRPTHEAG